MTIGYGISGIGYNPLGNYGLGMSGQYGSYDSYMPSMMGMNYGMGMNPSAYGMNGMAGMNGMMGMGMYYPTFMAQQQNQVEQMQLQHAGNMHTQLLNNEVNAHRETDSALMKKMLTNGDIQQGIQNLYNKVREGDQDGVCNEFDKLKNYVYSTYRDELTARGNKINPSVSATQYIEAIYGQVISAQTGGEVHDLRSDIKKYGDGSFENGFMTGFRSGHHGRYVDETINHCFGLDIDQKGSKDLKQGVGHGIGRAASALEKGVYGAAIGGATFAGLNLVGKGIWSLFGSKMPFKGKFAAIGAGIGAIAGIAGDIIWKST